MQFRAQPVLAAWLLCGLSLAAAAGTLKLSATSSTPVTISDGATLRLDDFSRHGAGDYNIASYIQIDRGIIESAAGNPHFTGQVTILPGGATFITRSRGEDMYFESDITGAGPLTIDNASGGTGGIVRFNNGLSLMGTIKVNGTSPGFSGGRIFLGDPDALNQATLDVVAGMRGVDFDPDIKTFSMGGLTGDASIDLKGKILRAGVSNTDLTYSGSITDSARSGVFMKSGTGTMTLTGDSRANMTVHFGTLVIAGTVAGEIKVGDPRIPLAPAVLMGTGSIGNLLLQTPGAVVQPGLSGNHTGILTVRNFSMIPGSNLSIRLGGDAPDVNGLHGYDQIRASGQFSLYGNLELSLADGFQPKPGDVFYIMATTGEAPVLGRFSNLVSNEFTAAGHRFRINYAADFAKNDPASTTGHDVALMALTSH